MWSPIAAKRDEKISDVLNQSPKISQRYAATETGFPKVAVWKFLRRELDLFHFRVQSETELSDAGEQKGVRFA